MHPFARPAVTLGVLGGLLLAGAVVATPVTAAGSPTCSGGRCQVTFGVTDAPQSFVVPGDVTRMSVVAAGAAGGSAGFAKGGAGTKNTNVVAVTEGDTLTLVVGRSGSAFGGLGYGGGGAAGRSSAGGDSDTIVASGGGASAVYLGGQAVSVAGGGGGGFSSPDLHADGGNGGVMEQSAEPGGGPEGSLPPTGATELAPGAGGRVIAPTDGDPGAAGPGDGADGSVGTAGVPGRGGDGGSALPGGSGGGGGYAGGGGGATGQSGAGGSSWYDSTFSGTSETDAKGNDGDGYVTLVWTDPNAATGTILSVTPSTPTTDDEVSLVAEVSTRNGLQPEGTVTFYDLDSSPAVAYPGCDAVPVEPDGTARCSAAELGSESTHHARADFADADGIADSSSPTLTWTVFSKPTITSSGPLQATYGEDFSAEISATGFAPLTFSVAAGSLPAGLTLDPGTGSITGTPRAAGTSAVWIRVVDGQAEPQSASQLINITVGKAETPEPVIAWDRSGARVGASVAFAVTARGDSTTSPVTTTNAACAVTGNRITYLHAGRCDVTVTQAGDDNHEAAAETVLSATVAKGGPAVTLAVRTAAVHGESVDAVVASDVAGTVSVTVDGTAVGDPVAVGPTAAAGGNAVVPLGTLLPGDRTVGATFTPTEAGDWDGSTATARTIAVSPATSTTTVEITPTALIGRVSVAAPSSDLPTGTVDFAAGGVPLGSAALVIAPGASVGVAVLDGPLPASVRTVTATWSGLSSGGVALVTGSSGTTPRATVGITATVSPARPASGWYRTPVQVSFTCTPATLACPAPVVVATSGRTTVARSATAADGTTATASVALAVDLAAPTTPTVRGPVPGSYYPAALPAASCSSVDALSGPASCSVARTTAEATVTWTATATDRAGNVARRVVTAYRTAYVSGADYRSTTPVVRGGKRYTLVVVSASRPSLLAPVLAPARPTRVTAGFTRSSGTRWVLTVTMPKAVASRPVWNLGIRIGSTSRVMAVRNVR